MSAGNRTATLFVPLTLLGLLIGCGGGGSFLYFDGSPYPYTPSGQTQGTGPTTTGTTSGGNITGESGGFIDPCSETQQNKFIRISMRNASPDYVHYFLILVAYVDTDERRGAVCPDDISLYTSNGYVSVPDGRAVELGNFCIVGPAVYYYHENGQFRGASGVGTSSLASAIAPAQGSSATYDAFFNSAGASLPVPEIILFHNPGTGEGAALKISENETSPCSATTVTTADPDCQQDAFYYVDEDDRLVGSTALGFGSGRRVPDEIQGTGCNCGLSNAPYAELALQELSASDVNGSSAYCSTFLRGGRIEFVFLREDTDPPFPQLVWRVTDSAGTRAHDFDARAGIP